MKMLFCSLLLFSSLAQAGLLKEKIHQIIRGDQTKPSLVLLENGKVVFVDSKNSNLLRELESQMNHSVLKTNAENFLESVSSEEFTPTVFKNRSAVEAVFNRLNRNYQRESQCFNRAHIWARDELKNFGTKSTKTFVFFTASYIWKNKFNWWFHVAPSVKVETTRGVEDMVLDYRYADSALSVKQWTDIFVYSKRPCLETTKFSDYDVNPQTEDCYLIKTNMFFWQPQDIKQRDVDGLELSDFNPGTLATAQAEAF